MRSRRAEGNRLSATENPGGCDQTPGLPRKGLERREVEKRIYGVERKRLTASATFLLLRYNLVLNIE